MVRIEDHLTTILGISSGALEELKAKEVGEIGVGDIGEEEFNDWTVRVKKWAGFGAKD